MAEEENSPDTLEVTLSEGSLDYKPGDIVWTRKAHYRIEQVTHNSLNGSKMFLLRTDLIVKPIVQYEENQIRVSVTDTGPKNPKVL